MRYLFNVKQAFRDNVSWKAEISVERENEELNKPYLETTTERKIQGKM
jgi:hypothetical protein